MQNSSFNIVQTSSALQKRWKAILVFVLLCGVAATITVFVVPPYFRSAATVVSANPALADKARFFDNSLQTLYSYFGSGDDLDRIYGVADMSATYGKLVDEFALVDYYGLKGDSLSILKAKAAKHLRKDIDLKKTEQNQLQIIVWTKNKELSANMVNRMVAIIQETAKEIWQKNYQQAIAAFDKSLGSMELEYMQLGDSVQKMSAAKQTIALMRMKNLSESINHFTKTSNEFRMGSQALPEFLYVMEPASPAAYAERPDKPVIILSACLLAFIFSSILVLVNDRKSLA